MRGGTAGGGGCDSNVMVMQLTSHCSCLHLPAKLYQNRGSTTISVPCYLHLPSKRLPEACFVHMPLKSVPLGLLSGNGMGRGGGGEEGRWYAQCVTSDERPIMPFRFFVTVFLCVLEITFCLPSHPMMQHKKE